MCDSSWSAVETPQTMPPTKLVVSGLVVHESADVVGGDHAADLNHVGVGVNGHFGEDGSPGLRGEGFVILRGFGGAFALDGLVPVTVEDRGIGLADGGLGLGEETAVLEVQIGGL